MAQARKSKELDHYLKNVISSVPKKLDPEKECSSNVKVRKIVKIRDHNFGFRA